MKPKSCCLQYVQQDRKIKPTARCKDDVEQAKKNCKSKTQHAQTYGCFLLDYTSAGWKITNSVCVMYLCTPAYACVYVCSKHTETLNPVKDYSINSAYFKITGLFMQVRVCIPGKKSKSLCQIKIRHCFTYAYDESVCLCARL